MRLTDNQQEFATYQGGYGANCGILHLAQVWVILPVLLWCAGVSLQSSQDRSTSDVLANSSGRHIAETALQLLMTSIIIVLIFPSLRKVATEFWSRFLVAVLSCSVLFSTLWSQAPWQTFKYSVLLIVSTAFVFWLKQRFTSRQLMQILMLVGVLCALMSIVAALFVPSVGIDIMHEDAWQGVFYSKNHMGRIFVFLLTPAIHYESPQRLTRWARNSYILLILAMIGLSESRGAWLLTAIYFVIAAALGIARRFRAKDRLVLVLIGIAVLIAATSFAVVAIQIVFGLLGRDMTLDNRTVIWGVLMHSVMKRPLLGFGYQAFWAGAGSEGMNALMMMYGTIHAMASYAHSGYLALLLEQGLIGVILVLSLGIRGLSNAWTCLRLKPTPFSNWYAALILLTLLYNIEEVTFMLPAYLPWMMFLLAVICLAEEAAVLSRSHGSRLFPHYAQV